VKYSLLQQLIFAILAEESIKKTKPPEREAESGVGGLVFGEAMR
jgi:hypothetical protein